MKIGSLTLSFCLIGFVNIFIVWVTEANQTNSNITAFSANHINIPSDFVLGQSTNDISIGISSLSCSNIFVCLFYVGQTNSSQLWVAPPQFKRVEYYLYDSSGKAIPYLATYHPASKIYKTILEVPKNVHGVHKGTMWPPFTMPYDQVTLTNVFQVGHAGDYKLVVKGRIMKINDDSSLSILEFPLVSMPVHLREQDLPVAVK
jgi:hypothetical protein